MSETLLQWVQSWIARRRPGEAVTLQPDTDLYQSGLLDSLGIIELIEALEDRYDFMFTEEEMRTGLTNVAGFESIVAAHT